MVYHDGQPVVNVSHATPLKPATVLERVLSFSLDYIILAPLVSFFNLVLFQKEMIDWKNTGSSAEFAPYIFGLIFTFVLFFSLLQSLFIYFLQATPGQYFLKVRMEVNQKSGLVYLRVLVRQITFWLSVPFLGIPWLAVLAHPESKTFYDRLTEISIVSLKGKQHYFKFELEKSFWRSFVATMSLFVAFLIAALCWQNYTAIKNNAYTFAELKKENFFCAEIDGVQQRLRLETVIALNLVGQIADICVDKEADFVLWNTNDDDLKSLAYYAKSLTVTETDLETENNYLAQACAKVQPDAFGCQIASAFQNDSLTSLYKSLKKESKPKSLLATTLAYELSILLGRMNESDVHLQRLKKFDSQRLVKKYMVGEIISRMNTQASKTGRAPAAVQPNSRNEREMKYVQKLLAEM